MPEYLVRLVQVHESFRKAEIEALADLFKVNVEFILYDDSSPFCLVRLPSEDAAVSIISRAVLAHSIFELWGTGKSYVELHGDVKKRTSFEWPKYRKNSFRFTIDSYRVKRREATHREIIESFSYMGFEGPIVMKKPELEICVFEEYEPYASEPYSLCVGRLVGTSGRGAAQKYDLKKRRYISTTSMDAELSLITANFALAAPGRVCYDPFTGTGSFLVACAHFGAVVIGSDIDGRSIRGTPGRNVVSNFEQYALTSQYLGGFVADLTNSPVRGALGSASRRWLDTVLCDPPYGVREGLKVLGRRDGGGKEELWIDGQLAHLRPGYIPPKRPYSFDAMLDDIVNFAADTLVDDGRLCLWMPTANDDDVSLTVPLHPCLKVKSVCVQPFNKWSRRLITYRRIPNLENKAIEERAREYVGGASASDLNNFRKKYFEGFKSQDIAKSKENYVPRDPSPS